MKATTLLVSFSLLLWGSLAVGAAVAEDTGAGVCVIGTGARYNNATMSGPFVGVNVVVGKPSLDNSSATFEERCCAAGGAPPDCFRPVR